MMPGWLFNSLRRQLILGTTLVIAVTMALFVWDLTARQRSLLFEHQVEHAEHLARSLATTSAGWLAAHDLAGLQELVNSQRNFPELNYAMILDNRGQVLAHSDPALRGQFVLDLPARAKPGLLASTPDLVDAVSPVLLAGRQVGWSRVGLGQRTTQAKLAAATHDGIIYALAAVLIGALAAGLMARQLTRRLHAIQSVADAVEHGDYAKRAQIEGGDEAGHLARAFNHMLNTLTASRDSLAASERALNEAQAVAGVGSWMLDIPSGQLTWSVETYRMFGVDQGTPLTLDLFFRLVHPEDRDFVTHSWQAAVTGSPYDIEHRIMVGDEARWVRNRAKILDSSVIGTVQDITERRQAEEQLRKLSLAVEQSPESIVITDLEGNIEYVNDAFVHNTGYRRAEAIGQNPRILKSGKTPPEIYLDMWDKLTHAQPWSGELFNLRKDGSEFVEHAFITPIRQPNGQITHYMAIKEDVTEHKQMERELAEHRDHLEELVASRTAELEAAEEWSRLILESSADGIYGIDLEGRISFINTAACRMLGHAPTELIGQPAHPAIHHSHADGTPYDAEECPMLIALREQRAIRVDEEVLWRADGNQLPVTYAVQPMRRGGKVTGMVVSFIDMTALRKAETDREAARAAAEHLARVKSEFLANMSHEIRTPLNAVLGLAQIGARDSAGRSSQETFTRIQDAGQHLLAVINDILDISKLDAGKLRIETHPFVLSSTLDSVIGLVAARAEAKGLALSVRLAPDLPARVAGDALRLAQILTNLLSNAIKFTPRGEVLMFVAREGDNIHFHVVDTGIGMNEEQVARLFTPFEQADSSTTREYGGTGLGLAISRDLARLMGGNIHVISRHGEGSSFTLNLPLPEASAPEHSAGITSASGPRLDGISVLAAEDVEVNRLILEDLLVHEGARVVFAENGQQAIERLEEAGVGAFDVVLMDIQMPVMDGFAATRQMREIAPALPVIGLTAHALEEERDKCLAAGMVAHVTKPINIDLLVAAILRHVPAKLEHRHIPTLETQAIPLPPFSGENTGDLVVAGEEKKGGVIDWPDLLARYKGRQDFIAKLAAAVLDSHAGTPERLRAAAGQGDLATLATIAHNLKSVGGNLMARRVQNLATMTEAEARKGESSATALAGELLLAVQSLLDELAERVQPKNSI